MSLLLNNNLSPLPFYTSEDEIKPWFAYGDYKPILAPIGYLPPFQVQVTGTATPPSQLTIHVYNADGSTISEVEYINYTSITIGSYKYFCQKEGQNNMSNVFAKGTKYIKFTYGGTTYYSGLFCNTEVDKCLKLTWKDNQNLTFDAGAVYYDSTNYPNNLLYLDCDLGNPSYEFDEEVEERDGYQFPIKQISYKKYKFSFLATEEMCDALRIVRLSDVVNVIFDGKTYECTSILLTPTWQDQGYLASVECEFTTDTVVKKIGQAY